MLSASLTLDHSQLLTIVSNIAVNVLRQTTLWGSMIISLAEFLEVEWLSGKDPYCQLPTAESLYQLLSHKRSGAGRDWLLTPRHLWHLYPQPPTVVSSWMVESSILQVAPNPPGSHHCDHSYTSLWVYLVSGVAIDPLGTSCILILTVLVLVKITCLILYLRKLKLKGWVALLPALMEASRGWPSSRVKVISCK